MASGSSSVNQTHARVGRRPNGPMEFKHRPLWVHASAVAHRDSSSFSWCLYFFLFFCFHHSPFWSPSARYLCPAPWFFCFIDFIPLPPPPPPPPPPPDLASAATVAPPPRLPSVRSALCVVVFARVFCRVFGRPVFQRDFCLCARVCVCRR